MAMNHYNDNCNLVKGNDEENDLFASWERVTDITRENSSNADSLRLTGIHMTNKPDSTTADKGKSSIKDDVWLDPCKFSGRIIRKSEVKNLHLPTYNHAIDSVTDEGDGAYGNISRKVTVLPPSVGYRGFCHVDDLSEKQRQPWKSMKNDNKSQDKGSTFVREYIKPDGRKVKILRIPDEDPPKKIKKVQSEKPSGACVKHNTISEVDEIPDKPESLKPRKVNLRKVSTDKSEKEATKESINVPEKEKVALVSPKNKSNLNNGSKNDYNSIPSLMKRPNPIDKKLVKKEMSVSKPIKERTLNVSRFEQNTAPPAKRFKVPSPIKRKNDNKVSDTAEDNSINVSEQIGHEIDVTESKSDDVLKDLHSVKEKLAKLTEALIDGDKENNEIDDENDKYEEVIVRKSESYIKVGSPVKVPMKKEGIGSSTLSQKAAHLEQVHELQKHQMNLTVDEKCNLKKRNERNEEERKAAQEYMRMKKVQWKKQQAKELDKKKAEVQSRQLKLQQLHQTQLKLLKHSVKKKAVANEKPNWVGPIHESKSPPPVPAKATTSLAEQVRMSSTTSPSKKQRIQLNKKPSDSVIKNARSSHVTTKQDVLKNDLVDNVITTVVSQQEITPDETGNIKANYDHGLLDEVQVPGDLSTIQEQSDSNIIELFRKTNPFISGSKTSVLNSVKDANTYVEAMTTEMKRLENEFKLLRERETTRIENTINEQNRLKLSASNVKSQVNYSIQNSQMPVGDIVPHRIVSVGNTGVLDVVQLDGTTGGVGEKAESSDDHPHSTTQDESISGGPLNELTDHELPIDRPKTAESAGKLVLNTEQLQVLEVKSESSCGNKNQEKFHLPQNIKLSNDNANNEPNWLKAFAAEPNPLNFITVVKSKFNIAQDLGNKLEPYTLDSRGDSSELMPNQDYKTQLSEVNFVSPNKTNLKRKTHDGRCVYNEFDEQPKLTLQSFISEDTDAPSISSMIEEIQSENNVPPLMIEDLKLNLPTSLNSELSSAKEKIDEYPSNEESDRQLYYKGCGIFNKSKSETFLNNKHMIKPTLIKPLLIPKSVKSLTLLPHSNICLSEEKINVPENENAIFKQTGLSINDADLVLKSSASLTSSVAHSNVSNDPVAQIAGSSQQIKFEEPRRHDCDRRKKINSSNVQDRQKLFTKDENFEIGNAFSPDALFLQFKAELSKLEVFEVGLAQVTATEHLRNLAISNLNQRAVHQHQPQDQDVQAGSSKVNAELSSESRNDHLYSHSSEPAVIDGNKELGTDNDYSKNGNGNVKVDDVNVIELHQFNNSMTSAHSSNTLQSLSEPAFFQVPSDVANENEDILGDKSKLVNLNRSEDTNLNTPSSPASASSIERSSNFNNLRFSFTNQRSAAKYSLFIFDQLINEQKLRSEQQQVAFKLREKALRDRTKAEITLLEVQRRCLREKGLEDQVKNIKKKQRGVLLKWKEDHDSIMRQRSAEELISQERLMMLVQQQNLVKMQMTTKNTVRKMKTAISNFTASGGALQKKSSGSYVARKCASMSSLPESSGNESKPVAQKHFSRQQLERKNRSTEASDERISSNSDKIILNKSQSSLSVNKRRTDVSDTAASLSDQHESNWEELKQQISRPRVVLDRSTSPFQLTPIDSNLEKPNGTKSVISTATDPITSIADNTGKMSNSIHTGQDDQVSSIPEELSRRSGSGSQVQEEISEELLNDENTLDLKGLPSQYSDNFESPLSSATRGSCTFHSKNESLSSAPVSPNQNRGSASSVSKQYQVPIKVPLTPQLQPGSCRTRKRYSSGSDESIILSQNETFSEQSDMEVRLSALHEQLRQRKLEAEKLRREQKRAQRERLKAKEQSLIKQIQAYDAYIEQVRKDLEQDLDTSVVPVMKPLIKQTRVTLRRPESAANKALKQEKKSVISDESISEGSSLETTIHSAGHSVQSKETDNVNMLQKTVDIITESLEISDKSDAKLSGKSPSEKWIEASEFFNEKIPSVEECIEESKHSVTEDILEQVKSVESNNVKTDIFDDKIETELSPDLLTDNVETELSQDSVTDKVETESLDSATSKIDTELSQEQLSDRQLNELPKTSSSDNIETQISQDLNSDKIEIKESYKSPEVEQESFLDEPSEVINDEDTDKLSVVESLGDNLENDESLKTEHSGSIHSQETIEAGASFEPIQSEHSNFDDSPRSNKSLDSPQSTNRTIDNSPKLSNNEDNLSHSLKKSEHFDSDDNSLKSVQSDYLNSENSQLSLEQEKSEHVLKSINSDNDKNSSLINNEVPTLHSENSQNDTFESDIETSDNESEYKNVPSDKSEKQSDKSEKQSDKSEKQTDKSFSGILDDKFPLPFGDNLESNILDNNEEVPEENVPLHSDNIIPSNNFESKVSDTNLLDVSLTSNSESCSSEVITYGMNSVILNDKSKVINDHNNEVIIDDDDIEENIEEEEVVKMKSDIDDINKLNLGLKPEDSFETKSNGTESDNTINFNGKSQNITSDSDKSLSLPEDDFSNKMDDVIKVFVTEKEKINKIIDEDQDVSNINEDNNDANNYNEVDVDETLLVNKNNDNNLKSKRVDRITDKILADLLKDSLSFSKKIYSSETLAENTNVDKYPNYNSTDVETPFITALKKEQEREAINNLENVMDNVLQKSVKEATDSMFEIYQNKSKVTDAQLLLAFGSSNEKSYDSVNAAEQAINFSEMSSNVKDQTFLIYHSPNNSDDSFKETDDGDEKKVDVKKLWLDEGMGLGRTCKEAEELRLQQLQIEEEIQQLERASAGQVSYDEHIPSYYYVREIPNKPPPPYTPPGQACIPTNQKDVLVIINTAIDYLYSAHSQGDDLSKLQPPSKLQALDDSPRSIYKKFLFDLIRQLILEAIDSGKDENLLPWDKTEYKRKCWIPRKTDEIVKHIVSDRVKVLFGFENRTVKENFIIRWSKKKRDKVDELLVRESQEEEQEWTDFSQDETAIKNKITMSIWDTLLLETGTILQAAYVNKMNRIKCLLNS